jgi:hypothetical protein
LGMCWAWLVVGQLGGGRGGYIRHVVDVGDHILLVVKC